MTAAGTFHDHGLGFSGPPAGQTCSVERHNMLVNGRAIKKGEAPETFEEMFTRAITFTVLIEAGHVLCRCCRYPIEFQGETPCK